MATEGGAHRRCFPSEAARTKVGIRVTTNANLRPRVFQHPSRQRGLRRQRRCQARGVQFRHRQLQTRTFSDASTPLRSSCPAFYRRLTCSADARKAAVKEYVQVTTNDTDAEPDATQLALIETWLGDKDYEKEIIGVLQERLEHDWPFNYKALVVCGKLKDAQLIDLIDKLTPLTKLSNAAQGATHIKKLAKPLFDKGNKAKSAKEAEEAKKRQDAIMQMWGGLWHNQPQERPPTLTFPMSAVPPGWSWPYSSNPPGYAPATSPWVGKGPDGWTGCVCRCSKHR